MARVDWRSVRSADYPVPADAPLPDLTTELTSLLGTLDSELRDELAVPVLSAWIDRGVYDDLLTGLGDGIAVGLTHDLDRADGDGVFRRRATAEILTQCIERDTSRPLATGSTVLGWADRISAWLLRETDLRDHVAGHGWVRAIGVGADAIGAVAGSPHCGRAELSVLLDVIGERVTAPVPHPWASDEADHLAAAALRLMRRDLLSLEHLEEWLVMIGDRSYEIHPGKGEPDPAAVNTDSFIRALYLQLALAPEPPAIRADLLLTVVAVLRELHPQLLRH